MTIVSRGLLSSMFSKGLPLSGLICRTGRELWMKGLQANVALLPSITVRSVGSIDVVWPVEIKQGKEKKDHIILVL